MVRLIPRTNSASISRDDGEHILYSTASEQQRIIHAAAGHDPEVELHKRGGTVSKRGQYPKGGFISHTFSLSTTASLEHQPWDQRRFSALGRQDARASRVGDIARE